MSRTIRVVTPENIQITYQLAGFASRFMAFLVDLLIQILAIVFVSWFIRQVAGAVGGAGISAASLVSATGILVINLILFAYAIAFEMFWGGRTPGKRLFGLRVIRDGGYPVNLIASVLRNFLRFIDFGIVPLSGTPLILFGVPGLVTIFLSPTYKRIGDYAAGTLVIVETGATPFGAQRNDATLSPGATAWLPYIQNIDRLTTEEYQVIRRFVMRRQSLDESIQIMLSTRLARPLMHKLEIRVPIHFSTQYADLLEALERRYAEERSIL